MEWLSQMIIAPLARRGGSIFAGWMVANGVSSDATAAISTGAVAAIGVAVDLGLSAANKRGWF